MNAAADKTLSIATGSSGGHTSTRRTPPNQRTAMESHAYTMQDNNDAKSSTHPAYLYQPLLPDNLATDHLGTPYTSNRAGIPLVSLQPKTGIANTQNMATQPPSTATASANRDKLTAPLIRQSSPIGRGTKHQKLDTSQKPVDTAPPNSSASGPPATNTLDDGFKVVQSKHKHQEPLDHANMQVSGLLLS